MPFRFEFDISNYKGFDSYKYKYYQIEHTTIGMISAKNEALEEYYKLYPNADEEQFLKIKMSCSHVDIKDMPQ